MVNKGVRLTRKILGFTPTGAFFFVVFELLAFTRSVILKQHGIEVSTFLKAALLAFVVSKAILVADLLPMINRFPNKPLMYNITWKTFIYIIASLAVHYIKNIIILMFTYKGFMAVNVHLLENVLWSHFWLVQLWLMVCFFMYNTVRELGRVLGREKLQSMFLGPREGMSMEGN